MLVGWMVHGGKLILVFISPLWLWSSAQINRGRRGAVVWCFAWRWLLQVRVVVGVCSNQKLNGKFYGQHTKCEVLSAHLFM